MSVFETIKNNNLTEAEVEEALEYYLDKKNKVFEKNEYKNRLIKNLKNYYDGTYSTDYVTGTEMYSNSIAAYATICGKLVDSLVDAGYKIVIPNAFVGYYLDPATLKEYPVTCITRKLAYNKALPEKIETNLFNDITHWVQDRDKQVIALYLPIFRDESMNLSCYGIVDLN